MRVLVTGSRDWTDRKTIGAALWNTAGNLPPSRVTLITGACPTGADKIATELAQHLGWTIREYPANWTADGKAAGPIRNQLMVTLGADICLAFHKNNSRGTADCIQRARAAGIPVRIWEAS